MPEDRIHRAISDDGTEIAGRVQGQGPPLVLVHGGIGDGDLAWEALLPHLIDRFTCYLPSTRGRGRSGDNPDHSPARLEEDVIAFIDSIGQPVCLLGWSGSGAWVLGATARSGSVTAVAAYEPAVVSVMRTEDFALTRATLEQVGTAAGNGRLADAVRVFTSWVCTEDEIAVLEKTDFFARWAGAIPAMLQFFQHDATYGGPRPTDPELLRQVAAPVLLLLGQQTKLRTFFADSAQHIAQCVPHTQIRELQGLGHFAPLLAPKAIAEKIIRFFQSVRQPV
jgi:pimeloyl-ACP methyl ester carboxylesterase